MSMLMSKDVRMRTWQLCSEAIPHSERRHTRHSIPDTDAEVTAPSSADHEFIPSSDNYFKSQKLVITSPFTLQIARTWKSSNWLV